jgi:hypothetical protein
MGYSMELHPTQVGYVQDFIAEGRLLGISDRGLAIAIATSCVECGLWNLASAAYPESESYPHDGVAAGDYDSVGLFQQRAAWGSYYERMTPPETARLFYTGGHEGQRGLIDFEYDSTERSIGEWAQSVQVSAFPDRYDEWADFAVAQVEKYGAAVAPVVVPKPAVPTWKDGKPAISAAALAKVIDAQSGKPDVDVRVAFRAAALRGCGDPLSRFARHGIVDARDAQFVGEVIRKVQTKRGYAVTGVLSVEDLHWLGGTRGSKFHAVV